MKRTIWICAAGALLALGCKGSDPAGAGESPAPKASEAPTEVSIKPGEEAGIVPLAEGNQWTYQVDEVVATRSGTNRSSSEVTFKILKLEDAGADKVATIEVMANGKVSNRQRWRLTKDGLFQEAAGLTLQPLTPPQPLLKFPVKPDDKYTWSGTGTIGGKTAQMKTDFDVRGSRLVDTEMGQMQAILLEAQTTITLPGPKPIKGASALSTWFKPGVGLVRIQETTRFPDAGRQATLRIKSFSPKQ